VRNYLEQREESIFRAQQTHGSLDETEGGLLEGISLKGVRVHRVPEQVALPAALRIPRLEPNHGPSEGGLKLARQLILVDGEHNVAEARDRREAAVVVWRAGTATPGALMVFPAHHSVGVIRQLQVEKKQVSVQGLWVPAGPGGRGAAGAPGGHPDPAADSVRV